MRIKRVPDYGSLKRRALEIEGRYWVAGRWMYTFVCVCVYVSVCLIRDYEISPLLSSSGYYINDIIFLHRPLLLFPPTVFTLFHHLNFFVCV